MSVVAKFLHAYVCYLSGTSGDFNQRGYGDSEGSSRVKRPLDSKVRRRQTIVRVESSLESKGYQSQGPLWSRAFLRVEGPSDSRVFLVVEGSTTSKALKTRREGSFNGFGTLETLQRMKFFQSRRLCRVEQRLTREIMNETWN